MREHVVAVPPGDRTVYGIASVGRRLVGCRWYRRQSLEGAGVDLGRRPRDDQVIASHGEVPPGGVRRGEQPARERKEAPFGLVACVDRDRIRTDMGDEGPNVV